MTRSQRSRRVNSYVVWEERKHAGASSGYRAALSPPTRPGKEAGKVHDSISKILEGHREEEALQGVWM